jgi:hypothetical protein
MGLTALACKPLLTIACEITFFCVGHCLLTKLDAFNKPLVCSWFFTGHTELKVIITFT